MKFAVDAFAYILFLIVTMFSGLVYHGVFFDPTIAHSDRARFWMATVSAIIFLFGSFCIVYVLFNPAK